MAARRYDISLRLLKIFILFFYYMNTDEIPNYFTFRCLRHDLLCNYSNSDLFTCEDNMLFSRVKISCFFAKAHSVFHWCLCNKNGYPSSFYKIANA